MKTMKIKEIKELLKGAPTEYQLVDLEKDTRTGVKKLIDAYRKQQEKAAAERERFDALMRYERQYYAYGAKYIAGVDEAGRAWLSGPGIAPAKDIAGGYNMRSDMMVFWKNEEE